MLKRLFHIAFVIGLIGQICLVSSHDVHAQSSPADQQKKRDLKAADRLFENREMTKANPAYQQIYNDDPNNCHAAYRLGRTFWYMGNLDESINYFRAA